MPKHSRLQTMVGYLEHASAKFRADPPHTLTGFRNRQFRIARMGVRTYRSSPPPKDTVSVLRVVQSGVPSGLYAPESELHHLVDTRFSAEYLSQFIQSFPKEAVQLERALRQHRFNGTIRVCDWADAAVQRLKTPVTETSSGVEP